MPENPYDFDGPTLLLTQSKVPNTIKQETTHIIYTSPVTDNSKFEYLSFHKVSKSARLVRNDLESITSPLRNSAGSCPYSRSAPSLIGLNTSSLPVTPKHQHSPIHSPNEINNNNNMNLANPELSNTSPIRRINSIEIIHTERIALTENTDIGVEISPVPELTSDDGKSLQETSRTRFKRSLSFTPFTGGPNWSSPKDDHQPIRHRAVLDPRTGTSYHPQKIDELPGSKNTDPVQLAHMAELSELTWEEARNRMKQFRKQQKRSKSQLVKLDKSPQIGTKVGEGHHNYVLMYNMLTGIRVAVSRYSAKPWRELTAEDFTSAHKLAFDITGNELTPSSKYDFKFKDYAPWVFRHLRTLFKVDEADYLVSLTLKYILSELSTPGKSGSFFYYSRDYRFIIKTVHHTEHKFFRKILKGYYHHIRTNPNTLVSRIFGLHRVKLPHMKKIHFIVMANVYPPSKDIHVQFDLKGSTLGRYLDESKTTGQKVLKDLNWLEQGRCLNLGPSKRHQLFDQLESDVAFLTAHNIMDYSLLLGIHNLDVGNRDKIRQNTLTLFDPPSRDSQTRARTSQGEPSQKRANPRQRVKMNVDKLRKLVFSADPVQLKDKSGDLFSHDTTDERVHHLFYQDDGGFLSTDEDDRPLSELYCMGIIDIMTPYDLKKKVEHFWKGISNDINLVSAVDPRTYGHRFLDFITRSIRNHSEMLDQLHDYQMSSHSKYKNKID